MPSSDPSLTTSLDLPFVRSHFPSLQGDWTYMDNAGGSQCLKLVADRISDYLLTTNVQHGASYQPSQQGMQRVAEATQALATFINAAHPHELVMGPSTSMMMRILSFSMSRLLHAGDEIIVTHTDHEANISPWMDLQRMGVKVKVWKLPEGRFQLDLKDLDALLSHRTRLVCMTHTSNVLGGLNPIKEITEQVHAAGAWMCVDGVAHAPHCLVDVQDLDVDFYAFSFYKVYGPHYAVLYGKQEHLNRLPGINHYFIDGPHFPYKFQPGNVNFEFAYGLGGLPDYVHQLAQHHAPDEQRSLREDFQFTFELIARHEARLSEHLLTFLNHHPKVRIIGHERPDRSLRVPTISFVVDGMRSDEIVEQVDPHHIGIRFGDFYAKRLIEDLGLVEKEGVVRVSLVHYNTLEEVDRLVGVLETVLD